MKHQMAAAAAVPSFHSDDVLVSLRQVMEITGLSRSAVYQQIAAGTFPRQVLVGERSVRWSLNEVRRWVMTRISLRDGRALEGRRLARPTRKGCEAPCP